MKTVYPAGTKHHLVGTHIMWYEIDMVEEYIASLAQALLKAEWPVHLDFMINAQTYLERPDDDSNALDLAKQIQNMILYHPFNIWSSTQNISTNIKTDDEPFYNIGDYRRETVNKDTGYTIWGEVDSLYPKTYFQLLEMIGNDPFEDPYVVSFASRKCWDETWTPVEHMHFQTLPCTREGDKMLIHPYNWDDYMTQSELDEFNDQQTKSPPLIVLPTWKFDGSLLAFSGGMPQLIPDDMHFAREDWCAQVLLEYIYPHIKQYHLPSVLKAHNYKHPKKRTHTLITRENSIYKMAERESVLAARRWLNNFGIEFQPNGPIIKNSKL